MTNENNIELATVNNPKYQQLVEQISNSNIQEHEKKTFDYASLAIKIIKIVFFLGILALIGYILYVAWDFLVNNPIAKLLGDIAGVPGQLIGGMTDLFEGCHDMAKCQYGIYFIIGSAFFVIILGMKILNYKPKLSGGVDKILEFAGVDVYGYLSTKAAYIKNLKNSYNFKILNDETIKNLDGKKKVTIEREIKLFIDIYLQGIVKDIIIKEFDEIKNKDSPDFDKKKEEAKKKYRADVTNNIERLNKQFEKINGLIPDKNKADINKKIFDLFTDDSEDNKKHTGYDTRTAMDNLKKQHGGGRK